MGACNPTPRRLPPQNFQPQIPQNYTPNLYNPSPMPPYISPHKRGDDINPGMWI